MSNQVEKTEKKDALQLVTGLVKDYEASGELVFPKNYSATNALKSAWLYLQETVDKNQKPVLEVCSQKSVVQALLKMVTFGLSVVKGQCYFIAYNGVLKCDISYEGNSAIAKRHGVQHIQANTIFDKDVFEFQVDLETGLKRVTKHEQTLDSIDPKNFKGAYCIVTFENGRKEVTIMTKAQIVQSWNQRQGNGLSPAHQNFGDRMAEKTVINRALTHIIRSSDDSDLNEVEQNQKPEIPKSANTVHMDFDEHEEIKEDPKALENKAVKVPEKKVDVLEKVGNNGGLFESETKADVNPF